MVRVESHRQEKGPAVSFKNKEIRCCFNILESCCHASNGGHYLMIENEDGTNFQGKAETILPINELSFSIMFCTNSVNGVVKGQIGQEEMKSFIANGFLEKSPYLIKGINFCLPRNRRGNLQVSLILGEGETSLTNLVLRKVNIRSGSPVDNLNKNAIFVLEKGKLENEAN